jgi:S-adenosylmethionine decarboxylase
MDYLGKHFLVELYGCEIDRISDVVFVENVMKEAAIEAGAEIITSLFHKFGEMGVAGAVIITDSYYGIRTWPEQKYVGLDLFACNEKLNSDKAIAYLLRKFGAMKYSAAEIKRGQKLEGKVKCR